MSNAQPPGNFDPAPASPGGYSPVAEDPGRTLGIVGLVLSIVANVIGLIISIIAFTKSKKAGFKNTPALAGIIIGAVLTAISIVVTIFLVIAAMKLAGHCADLGPGIHQVGGVTYTCS
jgi:heme/copper-type cytochrome/quinol oxidase subunit 2